MTIDSDSLIKVVNRLSLTVGEAALFFTSAPEDLRDGFQTTREVLSHLVFWHREYVVILGALQEGRPLVLRKGKFRELNELAYAEFKDRPIHELAELFSDYQVQLEALLESEIDPQMRIPLKQGSHAWSTAELIERVEAHVRRHLLRCKVAQQLSGGLIER